MFVLPETPQELADMGFGYEPLEGVYSFHIQSTPTYKAENGTVLFIVSPVLAVGPHPQEIGKKCRDFRIPLHEDWGRRQLRDLAEACGVQVRVGPNGKAGFEEGDFFNTYFQAEVSYTKKKELDKNGQEVERNYIRYNRLTPAKAPNAGAIPQHHQHQQVQAAPQQQQYAPAPQQYAAPPQQQYASAPQGYGPPAQPYQQQAPQGYGPPAQPYQQPPQGYPQGQAPAAAPPGAFVPQQGAAPAPTGGFVPPPAFGPPQGAPPQNGAPVASRGGRDIPSGDA